MYIDDLMKFREKFWGIFYNKKFFKKNFINFLAKRTSESEIWKVIKLACTVDESKNINKYL
jgi:hypothetical protein